jgi:hypothetical protein
MPLAPASEEPSASASEETTRQAEVEEGDTTHVEGEGVPKDMDSKGIDIVVKEVKKKTPSGKRGNLSEEAKENARLNLKKAAENKAYYRRIRMDLGLGARDPIPAKYKLPTKTYAPLKYPENKTKEVIDANENVSELKKESARAKKKQEEESALGITKKDSDKSKREKQLSRELKNAQIANLVRDTINDAMHQRAAIKAQLKEQQAAADREVAEKERRDAEQTNREKLAASNKRKPTRMRLSDGRIIEI